MMIPGPDSDENLLTFTWECIDFTNDWMDFLLTYNMTNKVSINSAGRDVLSVQFNGEQYFQSADG